MKRGRSRTFAVSLAAAAAALVVSSSFVLSRQGDGPGETLTGLAFEVKPEKHSYLPGEPVVMSLKVTNRSGAPVLFNADSDVWHGYVKIFVAAEGEDYGEYVGPDWGLEDSVRARRVKLEPGQSFETSASVLYNHRVATGHLNEAAARHAAAGRLGREYALATPGRYAIKAVLYGADFRSKLESGPVRVEVREPVGPDAEVWRVLSGNPKFGYFIQSGSLGENPAGPQARELITTLEGLLQSYPASGYAERIRHSLVQYRAMLEKIKGRGRGR